MDERTDRRTNGVTVSLLELLIAANNEMTLKLSGDLFKGNLRSSLLEFAVF